MWTVRNKDIIRNALVTVSVEGVRLSDVGVILLNLKVTYTLIHFSKTHNLAAGMKPSLTP